MDGHDRFPREYVAAIMGLLPTSLDTRLRSRNISGRWPPYRSWDGGNRRSIESGANEILHKGRYQFRERLMARKSSDVVAADDLRPGDSIVIFDQNAENLMEVTGFVAPSEPGETGFLVIASAARKGIWPALRVGRHGFATSDIVPGWTDRALADQFTLALVAILGFGAAIMTIIVGIHDLLAGRRSTAQPRSELAVAEASPKE